VKYEAICYKGQARRSVLRFGGNTFLSEKDICFLYCLKNCIPFFLGTTQFTGMLPNAPFVSTGLKKVLFFKF